MQSFEQCLMYFDSEVIRCTAKSTLFKSGGQPPPHTCVGAHTRVLITFNATDSTQCKIN